MGSDHHQRTTNRTQPVSIHAPTWGATPVSLSIWSRPVSFNPRSHMGSDSSTLKSDVSILFQSTLPHGERPYFNVHLCFFIWRFNPRSHMGSDFNQKCILSKYQCFNPRSHMGSDQKPERLVKYYMVSIHAPTWGAT